MLTRSSQTRALSALVFIFLCAGCAGAQAPAQLQATNQSSGPWINDEQILTQLKAYEACLVVLSPSGKTKALGDSCDERLPPQSSFKIPNALIGLETGVIPGVDHVIAYDGHPVQFEVWAKDHTLASAVESSVIWYFQALATRVGEAQMSAWLKRLKYSDADISGGLTQFWLNSSLKISAHEQVEFLGRLQRLELNASRENQKKVHALISLKTDERGTLYGKTGSRFKDEGELGWFVGWLSTAQGPHIFALHIRGEGASGRVARAMVERWLSLHKDT